METIDIFIFCLMALVSCIVIGTSLYFGKEQHNEWNNYINDAKNKLENSGLKYNHSYKLIHKDNKNVLHLRIFELKYSIDKKTVYAHAYMTTKNGEIGAWYDDFKCLLDINNSWEIIDCGEWNPNK